jgi:hypothetical protein
MADKSGQKELTIQIEVGLYCSYLKDTYERHEG